VKREEEMARSIQAQLELLAQLDAPLDFDAACYLRDRLNEIHERSQQLVSRLYREIQDARKP